jgi:hypothetical protein
MWGERGGEEVLPVRKEGRTRDGRWDEPCTGRGEGDLEGVGGRMMGNDLWVPR